MWQLCDKSDESGGELILCLNHLSEYSTRLSSALYEHAQLF